MGLDWNKGDIVKFGRVRFRVSKISSTKENPKVNKAGYSKIEERHPPQGNTNIPVMSENIIPNDSISNTLKSIESSMMYENDNQMDEWVLNYNSGPEEDHIEPFKDNDKPKSDVSKNEDICRIWLSPEEDPLDPLINLCSCSGTMKHTHFECMKHWLSNKLNKKEIVHTFSYNWKNLCWELWKTRLKG